MIKTLEWTDEGVRFIDQTKLPTEETYVTSKTYEEVADAIRTMIVRGAPAIGVAAAMGVALGVRNSQARDNATLKRSSRTSAMCWLATRPTAVNLFWAIRRMQQKFDEVSDQPIATIKQDLGCGSAASAGRRHRRQPGHGKAWRGVDARQRGPFLPIAMPARWPPPATEPRWGSFARPSIPASNCKSSPTRPARSFRALV